MDDLKIGVLEKVGSVGGCMSHPSSYKDRVPGANWSAPSQKRIAEYAMQQLEAARQKDLDAHAKNIPLIAMHEAIRERVTALFTEFAFPTSYSERDTKSRSRYPKSIRMDAGYLGDLNRFAPVNDGFAYATSQYERLKAEYEKYAQDAEKVEERENAQKARDAEAKKAARRADIMLAQIILRYGFDVDIEWYEVLTQLRAKDKRLNLAIAMQQTRLDWNDGPYRVRDALDSFTIETDEDKQIANDVLDGLHDFEDGRVFRDMRWGYDSIFASIADQQLVADAQIAAEKSQRYL